MGQAFHSTIGVTPEGAAKRRAISWRSMTGEIVQYTAKGERIEYNFAGPRHLFIAAERIVHIDGETVVEGAVRSTRRNHGRTMHFIPAGYRFKGWFIPRVLPPTTCLYLDPDLPEVPELDFGRVDFKPHLFFEDQALWDTAQKLRRVIEGTDGENDLYAETLAALLAIELVRFERGTPRVVPTLCGRLAGWQQRMVCEYIEDSFDQEISLSELAHLAGLSPSHFCRTFNRTVGMPPHRYQIYRRIERAKAMLANPQLSITEVAMACGYAASSNFSTIFRKVNGQTPQEYRRSLT
jgi:AraC family transcriptional regulator